MSNEETQLEKKINEYQALGKENPNINASLLMMNALQNSERNLVSGKAKKWAYLISIGVPPLGLLFALKYFFDDKDDAKTVAWTCVILTVISILIFWLTMKLFFASSGTSIKQIEQIKPSDIMQLTQ